MSGSLLHRKNRENDQKNSMSAKIGNLEILSKHGILCGYVLNSLILKIKDIVAQITENGTGKICSRTGKTHGIWK